MVLVKDPSTIEKVLRAEGKYPVRENFVSGKVSWLFENRLKKTLPMGFQ